MRCARRAAFTLVELSIVLVILGLLVGGVLAGQSLIHAAELRAVTTEFTNYKTSLGAFREKYMALPGDMPNAVRFWGAADGATTDGIDTDCIAITTAATGTETCNGNGNGQVSTYIGTTFWFSEPHEMFRAWQHLANAGLIEGTYSGVRDAGSLWAAAVGTNIPRSRFPSGGWSLIGYGNWAGDTLTFASNYGNVLTLGANNPTTMARANVMKAEDAYNVDMKMDDGLPHRGMVMVGNNQWSLYCVTSGNDAYWVSTTQISCPLLMKTGF